MVATLLFGIALVQLLSTVSAKPLGSSLLCKFQFDTSVDSDAEEVSFTIKYASATGIALKEDIPDAQNVKQKPVPDFDEKCPGMKAYGLVFGRQYWLADGGGAVLELDSNGSTSLMAYIKQRWLVCVDKAQKQLSFFGAQAEAFGTAGSPGPGARVTDNLFTYSCIGTQDIAHGICTK